MGVRGIFETDLHLVVRPVMEDAEILSAGKCEKMYKEEGEIDWCILFISSTCDGLVRIKGKNHTTHP